MRVAVVGAGIGGLAVSARLAAIGHQVEVFEKNDFVGGKMGVWESKGFRFDKGPSLFTMPQLIEDLFHFCGKELSDYFAYVSLDVTCNYFDQDKRLVAYSDADEFAAEAEFVLGVSRWEVEQYLKEARRVYEASASIFVVDNKSLMSWEGVKLALKMLWNGSFRSLNSYNVKHFQDPTLIKIFNRFATYNGSNPYKAPSVLSCIAALEHTYGAFYPTGGMSSIPKAIYQLGQDLGVTYHLNAPVKEITKKKGNWSVNAQMYDAIFYNGDIYQLPTLTDLELDLTRPSLPERSTSGLVFYWGVNREFKQLDVHNIFFASSYESEFEAFEKGDLYFEDPTIYVHISSKIEASAAPTGKENWFVMVNVPAKSITQSEQGKMRTSIIQKLNGILGVGLEELIETESYFNPQIMQSTTSAYEGALYGLNSNSISSMMKRPKNTSKLKGLYYVGGTVFPGGGIPLCLSSAKIAVKEFQRQ